MLNQFSRIQMLIGKDNMSKLFAAKVAVFGIGGVGGYATEALARSGIGTIDLFDHDKICITNLNRQLHATHKTIGKFKVSAAAARIKEINPQAIVNEFKIFYSAQTAPSVDLSGYAYIVDAIDTVSAKLELIVNAAKNNVPVISCMGAGNKLNAAALEVADIFQTSVCPLAKVMRHELKKLGIEKLKVVYSKEPPLKPLDSFDVYNEFTSSPVSKRQIPASNAFVPAAAGLIMAGEVINDLIKS